MNASNDYDLFRKWMRLSGELPANEGDRVIGLRKEENSNFWNKESHFNYYCYLAVSWSNLAICLVFSLQLFVLHFEVDWCTFILVQAFNVAHLSFACFSFLHQLYTTNIFFLQIIHFFRMKFKFFDRRLGRLNPLGSKKMNNRRLAKLIYSHNRVHLELIETNHFFNSFLGVNIIFFFSYALMLMSLLMFVRWLLRMALLSIVLGMFLNTIFVPFSFANSLSTQVWLLKFILFDLD